MGAGGRARWLSLVALCWALASRGATGSACAPCKPDLCAFVQCGVPELTARDECGCCERCLGAEGERCGGTRGARCGPGLVCVSQRQAEAPETDAEEGTGHCVCKEDGAVCGSDGRSYSSVCALHLHSWRALLDGRERVRKAHDGECKLGELRGAGAAGGEPTAIATEHPCLSSFLSFPTAPSFQTLHSFGVFIGERNAPQSKLEQ